MSPEDLPRYFELMQPTLVALDQLGGSASLNEINDTVAELESLSAEALAVEYPSGNGTVIADRLSWARSHLRAAGLLESGGRGIWILTDAGRDAQSLTGRELQALSREARRARRIEMPSESGGEPEVDVIEIENGTRDWHDDLLVVLRAMDPSAFERLAQRLLRESGFVKVEVTGRSGDGGIDGTGIMQLSLMSFHVLFQCKRYQGSVGSGAVRDFRGAMMGRTDKGLIITTGTFSPDARREATRDGAPPIDLIDGLALCEKLKELSLGVETKLVEEVSIKPAWFDQL
jgi:restriction system protein